VHVFFRCWHICGACITNIKLRLHVHMDVQDFRASELDLEEWTNAFTLDFDDQGGLNPMRLHGLVVGTFALLACLRCWHI